jgi:hypothetical protein
LNNLKQRNDITYQKGAFDFYRIASKNIRPNDKIVLITAGFHGNEIAGPLSLKKYLGRIFDLAHKNGIKLIVYPLCNPSGFEAGTRYDIDDDHGAAGNNDFLRYELEDGTIIDDLQDKNEFKRWHWASSSKLKQHLPAETALIHKLLKKEPLKQIVASIDLHQDPITPTKQAAAYFYSFADTSRYADIVKKIEREVTVWKNKPISAGFISGKAVKGDDYGFISRHDGSITDLFYRLGTPHQIAIETTSITPINTAMKVNFIWMKEIIKKISK